MIDLPEPEPAAERTGRTRDGGGLPGLSFCQGGANDPGQAIAISPFEAHRDRRPGALATTPTGPVTRTRATSAVSH